MQKYPNQLYRKAIAFDKIEGNYASNLTKHIFIEFADKTELPPILSKAIAMR